MSLISYFVLSNMVRAYRLNSGIANESDVSLSYIESLKVLIQICLNN